MDALKTVATNLNILHSRMPDEAQEDFECRVDGSLIHCLFSLDGFPYDLIFIQGSDDEDVVVIVGGSEYCEGGASLFQINMFDPYCAFTASRLGCDMDYAAAIAWLIGCNVREEMLPRCIQGEKGVFFIH